MLVITSCEGPDLDGVACSIAYSELLTSLGKENSIYYFGELGPELDFVRKFTNYFPVKKHEGKYDPNDTFIILDVSDPEILDPAIDLKKVIELFDHRQMAELGKFPNATSHIELVGSCATLIAEEFKKQKLTPSKNSAIYLYSAIVSNTINFKNSITTPKDREMAVWLKSGVDLPEDYIIQMFNAKSDINADNLFQILDQDFAVKTINGKRNGIAQIEVVNLKEKIKKLGSEFEQALKKLKEKYEADYIVLNGIDVIEGFNIFLFISGDEDSISLFSKALRIPNLYSGYKTNFIIMRKEIGPKIAKVSN